MSLNRVLLPILAIFTLMLLWSCNPIPVDDPGQQSGGTDEKILTQSVKIGIFSDPHVYDPLLGVEGSAINNYVTIDRKLIKESKALLVKMVDTLLASDVQLVIITGDLTKDGEKKSHELMARELKRLIDAGKKVYVINGNHDVSNPRSYSYSGDATSDTDNISPEEFKQIYADYGYNDAKYQDSDSLSYIVEPIPGLWLFAIDSCKYGDEYTVSESSGAISQTTLDWLTDKLTEAKSHKKIVAGFMHHGIVEHFTGQKNFFPDYLIDDNNNVAKSLGLAGLNLMFTGHFHAQDIVKRDLDDGNFIFDIETGSLVSAPCPYRIVELSPEKSLTVESYTITDIDYPYTGLSFTDYSHDFLIDGLSYQLPYMLSTVINYDYSYIVDIIDAQVVPDIDPSKTIRSLTAEAIAEHYRGDEVLTAEIQTVIDDISINGEGINFYFMKILQDIYTDLPPVDKNLIINLETGETE